MKSILKEKETEALKIYDSIDERRRYDALNLFLLEFGDSSPIILPDIAEYILLILGSCRADLLDSLCYLSQGYCLANTVTPLFGDDFRALKIGPRSKYFTSSGTDEGTVTIFSYGQTGGNSFKLNKDQRKYIDSIIDDNICLSPECVIDMAAHTEAFQNTKLHDIIAKDAIKGCFRKELAERKRLDFENHSPYVREILEEALEEHRMETLVKSIASLSAAHGLSVEDICSALEIDNEEYIEAKNRITEE